MAFTLPELPYAKDALKPHISAETLEFHHGKHHAGYVKKLNELVLGQKFETMSLEDVIRESKSGPIFNNAAQIWNHTFYWNSLSPAGGAPSGELEKGINKAFGSFDAFKKAFTEAALGQFGSGWAWLVRKQDGSFAIEKTPNAETPLTSPGTTPLLVCDVWEHAYYIDRRNDRAAYVAAFWNLASWKFAAENLAKSQSSRPQTTSQR